MPWSRRQPLYGADRALVQRGGLHGSCYYKIAICRPIGCLPWLFVKCPDARSKNQFNFGNQRMGTGMIPKLVTTPIRESGECPASMQDLVCHGLKSRYITNAFRAGVPEKIVSMQSGNRNLETQRKVYTTADLAVRTAAADAVANVEQSADHPEPLYDRAKADALDGSITKPLQAQAVAAANMGAVLPSEQLMGAMQMLPSPSLSPFAGAGGAGMPPCFPAGGGALEAYNRAYAEQQRLQADREHMSFVRQMAMAEHAMTVSRFNERCARDRAAAESPSWHRRLRPSLADAGADGKPGA